MKKILKNITIVLFILSLFIGITGVSYSWFSAEVLGNDTASTTVVELADLKLEYIDTNVISASNKLPGWSTIKTFTIENTGDKPVAYSIDLTNVTSSFIGEDLVYEISSTNNGANITGERIMPSSNSTLITGTIAVDTVQTYTMKLSFKATEFDQSSNMGKSYTAKIQINTGTGGPHTIAVGATNASITGGTEVENILPGGNFEIATEEWIFQDGNTRSNSNAKYGSYSIRNYHAAQYSSTNYYFNQSQIDATHKYYSSGWIYSKKIGNGIFRNRLALAYTDGTQYFPYHSQNIVNKWQKSSIIKNFNNTLVTSSPLKFLALDYNGTDQIQEGFGDGVMILDLTDENISAISGMSDANAKTWLDKNIPFFEGTGYVKSESVSLNGSARFNLTANTGYTYNELVCDGMYTNAVVNNNILTIEGVASDVQCSVFYR